MPHTWIRPFGDNAPTEDPAITAANRLVAHAGDYEDLTDDARAFVGDAKLVAVAFLEAVTE